MTTNPRKKIIMNEILFWKQNKLLPDHYCDFLMTLYSEGGEIEEDSKISHKKSVKAKEKRGSIIFSIILLLAVAIILAFLVLMSSVVWIVGIIAGAIALAFMIFSFLYANKNFILSTVLQVGAALLILGLSVKVSLTYFPDNNGLLYGLLLANCSMWVISGIKLKLIYFSVSGALCIVAILGYLFFF